MWSVESRPGCEGQSAARRYAAALTAVAAVFGAAAAQAAPLTVTVTDGDGRPVADAVVYVVGRSLPTRANPAPVQIAQRGKQFEPRVSVVSVGMPVYFPNNDTVRHHVYSFSSVRNFEFKLYAGTPSTPVVFDKPGTAVIGCNIHDRMSAWVHVVDTPLHTRTDATGAATLDVPPASTACAPGTTCCPSLRHQSIRR